MQALLPTLEKWIASQIPFVSATVIKTWGSAPRPVGSMLLVSESEEMVGSVSGGCVEGAIIKASKRILESRQPELLKFGVSNEEAWTVGLTCGGTIHVWVEPFFAFDERQSEKTIWPVLQDLITESKGALLLTDMNETNSGHLLIKADGTVLGSLPVNGLKEEAFRAYQERKSQTIEWEGSTYFARVFAPKSKMLIIGAAHITTDLVRLAKIFGFETIVIDPRRTFAEKTVFPIAPDQLLDQWPAEVLGQFELDAFTYAVLLSHDPKIDDQAIHLLLPSKIAYIGALGGRKSQEKRRQRLLKTGFSEDEIARIHGPIGVDINAQSAGEIALSIMAEIIKIKNQH